MKKIIFGVFPAQVKELIASHEEKGNIISDAAVYETLASAFSQTVKKANNSVIHTLEAVGLPTATAQMYKNIKEVKDQTLLAAVVPLEMEEKIRELFKKFRGNNISTINCP